VTSCLIETNELSVLTEILQQKTADFARQRARLETLNADFDRQRLTASPQIYSLLRGEVEQQELILQAALQAQADAENQLARAQLEEARKYAETARLERRSALQTELENHQNLMNEYRALYASLPEKMDLERQAHSHCLRQLADL
jgi:hypothetical protein